MKLTAFPSLSAMTESIERGHFPTFTGRGAEWMKLRKACRERGIAYWAGR